MDTTVIDQANVVLDILVFETLRGPVSLRANTIVQKASDDTS